jgi:6,7-dimethyl-8-ribityllumazine synthase
VRFAVVRSRFNGAITEALLDGCKRGFADAGIPPDLVDSFEVPGSFELPVAALWLARTNKYNAIACLGCIIRGDTPHFEHVAREAASGIADVALQTAVPVIFGVLTTDTLAQAQARSAAGAGSSAAHTDAPAPSNKGYEAAQSAVAMAELRRKFDI